MAITERPPRTKIIATLGPASSDSSVIRRLIQAGMNFARINASHGSHEDHARTIALVRDEAEQLGQTVGILVDLQGPKIRVGDFEGGPRTIEAGQNFVFAVGREPTGDELPTDYEDLDTDIKEGDRLLIDDGQISSKVLEVSPGKVTCRALDGGTVYPRKGINLPDSDISAPAFTDKDRRDVDFAVNVGVDAIALSFVRRAEDVETLKSYLRELESRLPVIAKIEKPQALDNLESILRASWGVMVARGDLGVELSPEEVPMAQKKIIHNARRFHRPVITATQMLVSMTENPRPTRAEASDVANAVLDGTDAVMLSQETAVGKYPVEALEMMRRIIVSTRRFRPADSPTRRRQRDIGDTPDAVSEAACSVAHHLNAQAIVAFTQTGMTAILAAARRTRTPILAFSNREQVRNLLSLVWGVQPFLIEDVQDTDTLVRNLDATLIRNGLAREGDRLVVMMGAPTRRMGPTNLMLVYDVGSYWDR